MHTLLKQQDSGIVLLEIFCHQTRHIICHLHRLSSPQMKVRVVNCSFYEEGIMFTVQLFTESQKRHGRAATVRWLMSAGKVIVKCFFSVICGIEAALKRQRSILYRSFVSPIERSLSQQAGDANVLRLHYGKLVVVLLVYRVVFRILIMSISDPGNLNFDASVCPFLFFVLFFVLLLFS